jgi:hypothetical protein
MQAQWEALARVDLIGTPQGLLGKMQIGILRSSSHSMLRRSNFGREKMAFGEIYFMDLDKN